MKKVILMAVVIVSIVVSASANPLNNRLSDTTKTKKVKPAKVLYTCQMHPDVLSDKPGKCPKPGCGMTLVKKNTATKMPMKHKMSM
ncbi:MAG TPA: hypothetical protein DCO83_10555 [Mucilaginibacter sp.]|jgi:hypothetical protein|nr:hypothetical protein [Mucilaginibacter sp.]